MKTFNPSLSDIFPLSIFGECRVIFFEVRKGIEGEHRNKLYFVIDQITALGNDNDIVNIYRDRNVLFSCPISIVLRVNRDIAFRYQVPLFKSFLIPLIDAYPRIHFIRLQEDREEAFLSRGP